MNVKNCIVIFFSLFANANAFAQVVSGTPSHIYKNVNKDANTALEIKDSIAGPFSVSYGIGSVWEIKNLFGSDEENSSWFKIISSFDTLLTFDIVPQRVADDFDFVIFKCPASDCVKKIGTRAIQPDRACFSINYGKNGSTGLSADASGTGIGGGPGAGYVAGLPVKKGDILYLLVNFPYDLLPAPFSIYFYNHWPYRPTRSKENKPVILENVLFKTNESVLLKESFIALDKLVDQLQKNKQMQIEIDGHTDNIGNEAKNQQLSEERAQKIVDYLVSKGIDKNRLSSAGFGSKQPITSNETEEGRKKNRRVTLGIRTQQPSSKK